MPGQQLGAVRQPVGQRRCLRRTRQLHLTGGAPQLPLRQILDLGGGHTELVEEIAEEPHKGLEVFTEGVPKIIRAGWAVVVGPEGTGINRLTSSSAAPETRMANVPWFPLERATVLDGEEEWVPETWRELGTELAATPLGKPDRVLVVGRPGGPMFRAAEVARLAHLAGIVAVVLPD